jgi:hypothetical protein
MCVKAAAYCLIQMPCVSHKVETHLSFSYKFEYKIIFQLSFLFLLYIANYNLLN